MRGTARQYALGRKIIEGKESNPIKKDISSPEKVFRHIDHEASIPSRAANSDSIQKMKMKMPSKNPIHRKDIPPPEKVFKQMDHQKIDSHDNDEKYNKPLREANKSASIQKPKAKIPSKVPTQRKAAVTTDIDDILDASMDDDIDDLIFDDDREVSRVYTVNKRARGVNFVIPDELIDVMTHKVLQNLKSHLQPREDKRPRIKLEIDI